MTTALRNLLAFCRFPFLFFFFFIFFSSTLQSIPARSYTQQLGCDVRGSISYGPVARSSIKRGASGVRRIIAIERVIENVC